MPEGGNPREKEARHRGTLCPAHLRHDADRGLAESRWQRARHLRRARHALPHGTNNGQIGFSARQAARAIQVSTATAARAMIHLQDRGFIVAMTKGHFTRKRHATDGGSPSSIATSPASRPLVTSRPGPPPTSFHSVPVERVQRGVQMDSYRLSHPRDYARSHPRDCRRPIVSPMRLHSLTTGTVSLTHETMRSISRSLTSLTIGAG